MDVMCVMYVSNPWFFKSHKNSFYPKDAFHPSVKHCNIIPNFLNYTIPKPVFISLEGLKIIISLF